MGLSSKYIAARSGLSEVMKELERACSFGEVISIIKQAARNLTDADGATLVLRDGDKCFYIEENAIEPLWKGQRFPADMCISGWVMINKQPAAVEDIYVDPRIPIDAYKPTFVKSLLLVPIRRSDPIGAIGNYWAEMHIPSSEEIAILQQLAEATSIALEKVELFNIEKDRLIKVD